MPDGVGIDVEIAGRFQAASDGIANTVPAVASSRREHLSAFIGSSVVFLVTQKRNLMILVRDGRF